jgi:hypothetical protein
MRAAKKYVEPERFSPEIGGKTQGRQLARELE